MNSIIDRAFKEMLENWQQMSVSSPEDSEADADRFQNSFYKLIELVRDWIEAMKRRPRNMEDALALPEIAKMIEFLPPPLYLNFETELECILEGHSRVEDTFDD